MAVISKSITQYGDEATEFRQDLVDVRYCLKIEFAPSQVIYIPSHDDVIPLLPPGASYTKARLSEDLMPNINRNAGFLSGKSSISTPTYKIVDVDNELSDLFANKNANNVGSFNSTITEWEFGPFVNQFYILRPKFTGFIQNHTKPYNTIEIETADINRNLDSDIFDPLKWKLASTITAGQLTIPTTLPVAEIANYQARLLHTDGWVANTNLIGGYAQIGQGEVFWYTQFEDVGGVATFTNVKRGVLGTTSEQVSIEPNTEEKDKPDITEWIVIDEPIVDLIKGLVTGVLPDGRTLPAHWCANQGVEWIDHRSFAALQTPFRLLFQNPGKTSCLGFLEKEVLPLVPAVMAVDGYGKLRLLPKVMPVDSNSGSDLLDESNCVDSNVLTLRHVKTNIFPSVKINYDWNPISKEFLSPVTYQSNDTAAKHKLDISRTKELSFKGLHAGLHTNSQIQKLIATWGDDFFDETLEFTVESFINNLPLGSLPVVRFNNVIDDANGSAASTTLERTMLVVAANENRQSRTTTYDLVGSLYSQSERQASQLQSNLSIETYKEGKINIAGLTGFNVTSGVGIVTGTFTLQMGKKYYYVDDGSPGTGLEFSASAFPQITGNGPSIELYVYGPFINKTTIDLTAKSNHYGGVWGTSAADPKVGATGYCLTTVSAGSLYTEQLYTQYVSSNQDVYTELNSVKVIGAGYPTRTYGRYARAPDPIINANNGIISGIPADLGGTGGGGGPATSYYDPDPRPQSSASDPTPSNPNTTWLNGSQGGIGGGGLVIMSWGGGNLGSGQIILDGGDAGQPNTTVVNTNKTLQGGRGSGGGPGSLLWLVDGNHAAPLLTSSDVLARYGDGSQPGIGKGMNQLLKEAGNYKSKNDATDHTFNHFEAVTRIAYVPLVETVKPRISSDVAEFFNNQRDGEVELFVQDVVPSNANIGDAWITQAALDANDAEPSFQILTETGWRNFVWGVDKFGGVYGGLIAMQRTYGTNKWLTSDTRPTAFEDGWAWTNELTGETWILYNDGNDILVQVGDSPVGLNHYRDGNFSLQQEAIGRNIGGPWRITDELDVDLAPFIPELVEGGTATPTPGGGTAPPPQAVVVTVNSPTQATVYITPPADDLLVVTYQIYRNGSAWQEVLKTSLFWTDTVVASTTYTYEVTSKDAAGDESVKVGTNPPTVTTPAVGDPDPAITNVVFTGGWVNGTDGGPVYTLDPVTGLTVDIYSSSSGELLWTPPGTAQASYNIEVRRNNELRTTLSDASNTSSYYFEDMEPDTFYTWAVRVVSGGERSDDVEVSATSNAAGGGGGGNPVYDLDPPTLRNGDGHDIYSSSSAELFWNPPGDVGVGTGYEIYQDGVLRDTRALPTYDPAITNSYYMDSGLSSGITYTWWVRLVNTGGSERSEDLVIIGTMN